MDTNKIEIIQKELDEASERFLEFFLGKFPDFKDSEIMHTIVQTTFKAGACFGAQQMKNILEEEDIFEGIGWTSPKLRIVIN